VWLAGHFKFTNSLMKAASFLNIWQQIAFPRPTLLVLRPRLMLLFFNKLGNERNECSCSFLFKHTKNWKTNGKFLLGTKRAFQSPSQFLFETFSPRINIWRSTLKIRAGTRTCVLSDFHQNCILSANLVKPPNIKLHESQFRGSPNKHDYYSCSPSGKHNSCSTKKKDYRRWSLPVRTLRKVTEVIKLVGVEL